MTNKGKVLVAVIAVVVVLAGGVGLYLKGGDLMGKLSPTAQGTKAAVIVDSAYLDTDFDGVQSTTDKCPDIPAYQIARFGPKDYLSYLGQVIKLDSTDIDAKGKVIMSFDVGGIGYNVDINKVTYVKSVPRSRNPGFSIRGIWGMVSPSGTTDEAIVVVSRTDYNIDTGCGNK